MRSAHSESGFSLPELLVATCLLLIISSIVTQALLQITNAQTTIWNRTEMHSGIRGATELLQQEVGQAGRLSLPGTVTLAADVAAGGPCDASAPATSAVPITLATTHPTEPATRGIYASDVAPAAYMLLTTMDGNRQETIKVASVDSATQITACAEKDHDAGTVLLPMGAFATGIIPDSGIVNGSTPTVLKMFGDINGDGTMVYVEYTCDTVARKLYRQVWDFDDAGPKTAPDDSDVLLGNIIANPGGTPCFTYQTTNPPIMVQGTPFTFVLDVAITLTVETEQIDPITRQKQTETKALLNVSPRNVFNAWMLVGMGYTDRIQSTPATVTALLAPVS